MENLIIIGAGGMGRTFYDWVRECVGYGERFVIKGFIDDNINAVSAAKKAGMTAIGIYDRSSDTLVDRMKKISDRYIYDFREL